MSIVVPSDFIGKFEISQNPIEKQKLQSYIDSFEDQYMIELLGVELYNEYKIGLGLVTPDPIYVKLRDPFYEDLHHGCYENQDRILISKGVKSMLLGFIYYEFYADDFAKASTNGLVKPKGENSTNSTTFIAGLYSRYNTSLETYRAIQRYIHLNRNVYPKFNGIHKNVANWL